MRLERPFQNIYNGSVHVRPIQAIELMLDIFRLPQLASPSTTAQLSRHMGGLALSIYVDHNLFDASFRQFTRTEFKPYC